MDIHQSYMERCLHLAALAAGKVAPNPMVGSVLVYEDRIIGEGYHKVYGQAHAEVNCILDAEKKHKDLVSSSTLYVSLEPCAHFGKTPPCADLIIEKKIPRVVIGCRDPFEAVNGKGIEKLEAAGIEVIRNLSEASCEFLNRRFFTFHTHHRPYVILKWAESSDGIIGYHGTDRLMITNDLSSRLVHKWRAEEQAILVGTNTAMTDNPSLTTRLWKGRHPVRVVIDRDLRLPKNLHLFTDGNKTIVLNQRETRQENNVFYHLLPHATNPVSSILKALYELNIQSVLVEGGSKLLQSFIDEDLWDEARVITNTSLFAANGVPSPRLLKPQLIYEKQLLTDRIRYFKPRVT